MEVFCVWSFIHAGKARTAKRALKRTGPIQAEPQFKARGNDPFESAVPPH